jgi:chitinase
LLVGVGAPAACGSSTSTDHAQTPSPEAGSGSSGGGTTSSSGSTSSSGGTSTGSSTGGSTSSGGGSPDASAEAATKDGGNGTSGLWVTGYYPSWNDPTNQPASTGNQYPVTAIDWAGLSEVASAFYIPDGNGGWAAGSFDQASATSLIASAHAAGKKAIASIGGANSGAGFEGSMTKQAAFMSALGALVVLGYDGIDIDWEGGNQTLAQDQALETTLIQGLRSAHPTILLTMTAGYVNRNLAQQSDFTFYGSIAASLDRINLMTYGMAGAYSGWESWHSSPLHWNQNASTPTGIDDSVGYYLAAGVPPAKLGVGIGFYGMCYTSPVTAPVQTLGASTVAAEDGVMTYANILANYYSASAYHYDTAAAVPYLTLAGNNAEKCTYVTYEDATSIADKAAWVKAQGLGGVIIWSIDEGYVRGAGSTVAEQNPLLEATKTGFL